MAPCLFSCTEGIAVYKSIPDLFPESHSLFEHSCRDLDSSAPLNGSDAQLLACDAKEAIAVSKCIRGCSMALEEKLAESSLTCAKLEGFRGCVHGCPLGSIVVQKATELLPKQYLNHREDCGILDMDNTGNLTTVAASGDVNGTEIMTVTNNVSHSDSAVLDDCFDTCFDMMESLFLNQSEANRDPCTVYNESHTCSLNCENGANVVAKVKQVLPASIAKLETDCISVDESQNTTSKEEISQLDGEADRAEELRLCLKDCESYISRVASDLEPLDRRCSSWRRYEACVLNCPEGALVMDMAHKSSDGLFGAIMEMCGESKLHAKLINGDRKSKPESDTLENDILDII